MKMDLIHNKIVIGSGCDNADDVILFSSNPNISGEGLLEVKTATANTLHVPGSPMKIILPKQYTIDMDKVLESKDINSKINALLSIFSEMNITIQDYAITEELKKYTKEIK